MSLSTYSRNAYSVGTNLRLELLAEEYEPFLGQLSDRSPSLLTAFARANVALIERVATAAPARQRQILEKLTVEQRFWTIAAAAQMAFEAAAVLDAVDEHLVPGCGYREMIGRAHDVLCAPYQNEDCGWPFPVPCPNPDEAN